MASFEEKLLSIARPVSYLAGALLVRQGEPSRGAFLIRQGAVEARVALPGGGSHAVARLGEGEMFGEMALMESGVCSASVVALGNVDGWFIERGDFRAMSAGRDAPALEAQRAMTLRIAARLRALNASLREHSPAAEVAPAAQALEARRQEPGFDWRAFLRVLPFFEGFDPYEVDELAAAGSAFELPRGARLFGAGDPPTACFIVVRGALEVYEALAHGERRIAIAGPGELVGYLSMIERAAHGAGARVREDACLLAIPAAAFLAFYEGSSGTGVRLLHAIQRSLLKSLARTNTQLTRAISHARLSGARADASALEQALHGQVQPLPG